MSNDKEELFYIGNLDNLKEEIQNIKTKEDIQKIKDKILLGVKELSILNDVEGKKKSLAEYSDKWRKIYKKIQEPLRLLILYDTYLSHFDKFVEAELNDTEINKVIFRCVKSYKAKSKYSFFNYLNKSTLNDCKYKIREKYARAQVVQYEEEKEYQENQHSEYFYEHYWLEFSENYDSSSFINTASHTMHTTIFISDDEVLQNALEKYGLMTELYKVELIFKYIERKYKSSKAGQKLKRACYTYAVLDYLYILQDKDFDSFCEKYSFIHKDAINHFRDEYFMEKADKRQKENWIKQSDFADYTDTENTHYAKQIKKLKEYLHINIKL